MGWAQSSESRARIEAMIKLAESDRKLAISAARFAASWNVSCLIYRHLASSSLAPAGRASAAAPRGRRVAASAAWCGPLPGPKVPLSFRPRRRSTAFGIFSPTRSCRATRPPVPRDAAPPGEPGGSIFRLIGFIGAGRIVV